MTLKTVDEDAIQGTLVAISRKGGVVIHTIANKKRHIPLQDLVRIDTDNTLSQPRQRAFTVSLEDGDILHGDLIPKDHSESNASAQTIVIETADLGRVSVPLDVVARVDSPRAMEPTYRDSVEWLDYGVRPDVGLPGQTVRAPTTPYVNDSTSAATARSAFSESPETTSLPVEDRILLTNGDRVRGFVTAVGTEGIAIESDFGPSVIPLRLVVAARLAGTASMETPERGAAMWSGAKPTTATLPQWIITFRSSGRLTVADLDWAGARGTAKLLDGRLVQLKAERIVRMEIVGGRWEWLSQHRPVSFEHTPMLSLAWEYVPNRNVLGQPITVAGKRFEYGIGVHSRTSLIYNLNGQYSQFVTSYGLDDHSGRQADVSVAVLVDGRPRFHKSHVRPGKLLGPLRLDITHANSIQLIVDFGDNGDLQDRFDWVNTALIH